MTDTIAKQGGEFAFIKRILNRAATSSQVLVGPGDDAAVLRIETDTVVTADMLVEDVHFRQDILQPHEIGWRSAVASLSDIAAMGASPLAGILSIALPTDISVQTAEGICHGVIEALEQSGAVLAGGDTVSSPGPIVVNITLLGQSTGPGRLRTGAMPGDILCVTGELGGSRGGLEVLDRCGREQAESEHPGLVRRYARPQARMEAGILLREHRGVHAMMDISDGLASDVLQMAQASQTGVIIFQQQIPVDPGLITAQNLLSESPVETALRGGEDFELLFAADPSDTDSIRDMLTKKAGIKMSIVGECISGDRCVAVDEQGNEAELKPGFVHF